jgi:H+-transporting ATPase
MMYLLLSVAGHLTIFQTRTRGPWWSTRPATILLVAVVGTQTIATLICLFGFLVTPLWWGWAAMVWAYALAWFLLTDPVKLLAYRVLDATKAAPALQSMIQPRSDIKAAPTLPQPDPVSKVPAEAEPQPEAKSEPQSEARPQPAAEPTPAVDTAVTTLMNTTLGELLVAGALKHPEDAGQILADGLVQTKAHIQAGKASPPKVDSNPESEVKAAE